MENKPDPVKGLRIMHMALCIGASLIIVVNHCLIKPIDLTGIFDSLNLISIVGLGIAVVSVLSASYLFNKRTIELGADLNSENMNDYRAAYVLKWSWIEAVILTNALFYFSYNADPINILVSILLLFVLYFSKPIIV